MLESEDMRQVIPDKTSIREDEKHLAFLSIFPNTEGFGVDHVHAKLFPMHGTKMTEWKPLKSKVDKFFEKYEGYISSHDYKRADDERLFELAKKIRK